MIGFLIGLFIGGFAGVAVMALMQIAGEDDRRMEDDYKNVEA